MKKNNILKDLINNNNNRIEKKYYLKNMNN